MVNGVIGKRCSGYTLLEILGVIALIGLIYALVQPEFALSEERNRVRYVGLMLQADLQAAGDQAKTGNEIKVAFHASGYRYKIGDALMERDYRRDGLVFTFRYGNDDAGQPELVYKADGSCRPGVIDWGSRHYRGSLELKADGTISWSYHGK